MEAYKSSCPDCGHTWFWTGFKTGIGKTQEQLAEMKRKRETCVRCGSTNAKTGLDHESDLGKTLDSFFK